MYLVFTRMPGESYRRRLRSLLLYLCYVFQALISSLVCWLIKLCWNQILALKLASKSPRKTPCHESFMILSLTHSAMFEFHLLLTEGKQTFKPVCARPSADLSSSSAFRHGWVFTKNVMWRGNRGRRNKGLLCTEPELSEVLCSLSLPASVHVCARARARACVCVCVCARVYARLCVKRYFFWIVIAIIIENF